jgi:hypothetical protein
MPRTITVTRKAYHRKAFTNKRGIHFPAVDIPAKTYERVDLGKPGKTPAEKKWFPGLKETGWSKDLPPEERRELVLTATGGDYLEAARHLQALANVSTDEATKRLANIDADWFFEQYRGGKGPRFHPRPAKDRRRKHTRR